MHRDGAVRQTPFLHYLGLQTLPYPTLEQGEGARPELALQPSLVLVSWDTSYSQGPLGRAWAPGHVGKRGKHGSMRDGKAPIMLCSRLLGPTLSQRHSGRCLVLC